jgi:hypothetical protein
VIIISHTEIPKWTQAKVREWYPGYTVLGSTYGWFAPVHDTKVVFVDLSWKEVMKAVTAHMRGNGVPVPADLSLQLMEEYCRVTGSNACGEEDTTASERQKFMTMASRFLRAMEDAATNGLVSQEEAERRAAICVQCPYNQAEKFSFCGGCSAKTAAAKLARFALGRSTPLDGDLKTCSVCSCRLSLKVWVRREAMDEPSLRDKWAPSCWMRPEN